MAEEKILGVQRAPTKDLEELFVVRNFRAADRDQLSQLHDDGTDSDSFCCDCETETEQSEGDVKPHNHLWVAEFQEKIIGTVAISVEDEEVAHLHCLRVLSEFPEERSVRKRLIQAATGHVRAHGSLKLVLHANVDEGRATAFLHRLGFEFSRHREFQGKPALEFYLNLYRRPELGAEGEEGSASS